MHQISQNYAMHRRVNSDCWAQHIFRRSLRGIYQNRTKVRNDRHRPIINTKFVLVFRNVALFRNQGWLGLKIEAKFCTFSEGWAKHLNFSCQNKDPSYDVLYCTFDRARPLCGLGDKSPDDKKGQWSKYKTCRPHCAALTACAHHRC